LLDAENSNRGQQFQHRRKDSQEQHSFRNHHHVFSKKFFCISFSFSSLLIQDIESFNKSISTSSLIQNLPSISPAISLPNPTEIILSCHLTPSCTSLISFEFDVNLNRINLSVDSILRLVKIIQSKLPKKIQRGPIGHANPRFGHLPNNKSKGFTMANFIGFFIS